MADARDFPEDFIWGAATAAHQVEGSMPVNDWIEWERQPGRVVEPVGDAIDQWHRWRSDLDLLEQLGLGAYRFSVEWSRLEPSPGEWDEDAFDHYRQLLTDLRRRGMLAFVTLFHFTLPTWFPGWLHEDAGAHWARFVGEVGRRLGELVPYFCTVNEPQIVALVGHVAGLHPPGHQDLEEGVAVNRALMAAHRDAVAVLRECAPGSRVGTCLQVPHVVAASDSEADILAADLFRAVTCDEHVADLLDAPDPGDYVGLQYYTRVVVGADGLVPTPPDEAQTLMGWAIDPEGFGVALRRLGETGLPVVVTENGIATADDSARVDYLARHLAVLSDALRDGVDVRGYLYWSAFDNFEWTYGYRPTFGLIAVDRETMERTVKPSGHAYGRLIASGSLASLSSPA